ncbi:MAG: hypothetical protein GX121_01790 [Ignavibacteria bacterium]|nr:hypothetical protein [Ignavibacteria bacterium]
MPINNIISEIEKFFANSKLEIIVKVADSSLINPFIKKNIRGENISFAVTDSILKVFGIKSIPTLIVLNFHNDEIARFEKDSIKRFSAKSIQKLFNHYLLDYSKIIPIKYPIGNPQVQSFFIKENNLSYVDIMKNEIGVFNIHSGDSVNTFTPDSALIKKITEKISVEDLEWLHNRLYPIFSFNYAIPTNNNEYLCNAKVISGVKTDTIVKNVDSVEQKMTRKKYLNRNVNVLFGNIQTLDSKQNNTLANSPKQFSSNLFVCHNIIKEKNYNNHLDSLFLITESNNPHFLNSRALLSLNDLKKAYKLDSVHYIPSIGLIDYNKENDEYFYLNPWLKTFISINRKNFKTNKICAKGLLNYIVETSADLFEANLGYDNENYYIMEAGIIKDTYNILILPLNKDKSTDYYVTQKYDLNGNFISENYYHCEKNDKIFKIHFITDYAKNTGYFLIQSKKRSWYLTYY